MCQFENQITMNMFDGNETNAVCVEILYQQIFLKISVVKLNSGKNNFNIV